MIPRNLESRIHHLLNKFPIISLTGPRQSGKTTLLRHAFSNWDYFNMERTDHYQLVSEDPLGFLKDKGPGIIVDEAQRFPELFSAVQVISDDREINGQYIMSGSQSFLLNNSIAQSLAGRVGITHLFPFDITEIEYHEQENIYEIIRNGFYPRLHKYHMIPDDFYPPYIQTYIERDIRSLRSVENLQSFTRFLGLCAGRIGQLMNLSELANDNGIAVNTAKSWISLLEASFIVFLLQPYHRNFNKRLIKSPKLFFFDTGVATSLLRIPDALSVRQHYLYGSLFENLIIAEIFKATWHSGKRPNIYYWRESNGTEIDCIIEKSPGHLIAIEIKGGQTFTRDYLKNLKKFASVVSEGIKVEKMVVYAGDESMHAGDIHVWSRRNLPVLINQLAD